jgi:hypothetical protein
VRFLINGLKTVNWDRFDPFRQCGLVPLEHHTRDFLAALLEHDPSTLSILLKECAEVGKSGGRFKKFNVSSYEVSKEVKMGKARPDVVVHGESFLVAIEIKRSVGFETEVRGEKQCVRLNRGAKQFAKEKGIDSENVLAIFLTPQGISASDREVVPLSALKLFKRIERAMRSSRASAEASRARTSFMDFLRRS